MREVRFDRLLFCQLFQGFVQGKEIVQPWQPLLLGGGNWQGG